MKKGYIANTKPTAQITKLLHTRSDQVRKVERSGIDWFARSLFLGDYALVFHLLDGYGFRISEVLSISSRDITARGNVIVRGLKGSGDRLIVAPELAAFFLKKRASGVDPFGHLNRYTAYRRLKELGIVKRKPGRKNASVTHSFRDEYVKGLREVETDNKVLKQFTGHKSGKSVDHYGKD